MVSCGLYKFPSNAGQFFTIFVCSYQTNVTYKPARKGIFFLRESMFTGNKAIYFFGIQDLLFLGTLANVIGLNGSLIFNMVSKSVA